MNSKSNPFTSDECAFLAEMLRIAQSALLRVADDMRAVNPRAQCVEMFVMEAEHCADLRETIEALD
jgi:hypothetical protein